MQVGNVQWRSLTNVYLEHASRTPAAGGAPSGARGWRPWPCESCIASPLTFPSPLHRCPEGSDGKLLWICNPIPCSPRLAGASCADRVLLRQGSLARHAPGTAAGFVGQALDAFLQKPLHPFIDMATADPNRRGNGGDRDPIGHE